MKFDKKVMESGVVVAFTLVVTISSVCSTNVTTQSPEGQAVELSAEPIKVSDETVTASKERFIRDMVMAAIAENEPEQNAEDTREMLDAENAEDKKESSQETAETKENNQTEETAGAEENEQAEETADAEKNEQAEETAKTEEDNQEEAGAEENEQSEEAVSDDKEVKEQKNETSDVKENSEEAVVDGIVEVANEEMSPWASKLLPNVEDYLNIRTEASDEAELAGKLHKGASAEIIEKGDEWSKIRSGNVEGYVKNEFCVVGLKAEELANQVGTTYATATTGGVRVRENASSSEDTEVVDVLEEGGKLKVDTQAEAAEGWVAVKTDEGTGYVSAEYVNVELKLGKAISIEEERAAIAAAEAEKAKKAQQAAATSQRGAVAASYDDVTLLGALIQCEAGSEPYEGKLAVGAVVMNRLRAGYAGSISGVIYQSGQFSPASSGKLASVLASGVSGSCIQAAQEAIGGASNVGGATSFKSASSGAAGIVIGNHVFF